MIIKNLLAASCMLLVLSGCACKNKGVAIDVGPQNQYSDAAGSPDLLGDGVSNRVHFAFDSSELDSESKETLSKQAEWLKNNSNVSVVIEGHCDERGTRDYNMALGERRANQAVKFLSHKGVEFTRLETISYGKERPAMLGDSDEAHKMNRRAVTVAK